MSVHYKFRSANEYSTLPIDGINISVEDLKEAIIEQKRLSRALPFDLVITNAETDQQYTDEKCLIPKNSSLLIARVPIDPAQAKKAWNRNPKEPTELLLSNPANLMNTDDGGEAYKLSRMAMQVTDLTKMTGSEQDKINAMMVQSTIDYHPTRYVKLRNSRMSGKVPAAYTCYKCSKGGHWVSECPLSNQDLRKSYGIPSDQLVRVTDPNLPGVMVTAHGKLVIYKESQLPSEPIRDARDDRVPLPEELQCSLCDDILKDAVLVPCCGMPFCDDCIRNHLLDSLEEQCPKCTECGVNVGTLIPTRYLRKKCHKFDKQTNGRYIRSFEARLNKSPQSSSQVNAGFESRKSASPKPTASPQLKCNVNTNSNVSSKVTSPVNNVKDETEVDELNNVANDDENPNKSSEIYTEKRENDRPINFRVTEGEKIELYQGLLKDVEEQENYAMKRATEEEKSKKNKKAKKEKKKEKKKKDKKEKHRRHSKASKSPGKEGDGVTESILASSQAEDHLKSPPTARSSKRSSSTDSSSSDCSLRDKADTSFDLYNEAIRVPPYPQPAVNMGYPPGMYAPAMFSVPPPGYVMGHPNTYMMTAAQPETIDDPLAAFEKHMREQDERRRRELEKRNRSPSYNAHHCRHNRRSWSRSRSRSTTRYYRSPPEHSRRFRRSRSPGHLAQYHGSPTHGRRQYSPSSHRGPSSAAIGGLGYTSPSRRTPPSYRRNNHSPGQYYDRHQKSSRSRSPPLLQLPYHHSGNKALPQRRSQSRDNRHLYQNHSTSRLLRSPPPHHLGSGKFSPSHNRRYAKDDHRLDSYSRGRDDHHVRSGRSEVRISAHERLGPIVIKREDRVLRATEPERRRITPSPPETSTILGATETYCGKDERSPQSSQRRVSPRSLDSSRLSPRAREAYIKKNRGYEREHERREERRGGASYHDNVSDEEKRSYKNYGKDRHREKGESSRETENNKSNHKDNEKNKERCNVSKDEHRRTRSVSRDGRSDSRARGRDCERRASKDKVREKSLKRDNCAPISLGAPTHSNDENVKQTKNKTEVQDNKLEVNSNKTVEHDPRAEEKEKKKHDKKKRKKEKKERRNSQQSESQNDTTCDDEPKKKKKKHDKKDKKLKDEGDSGVISTELKEVSIPAVCTANSTLATKSPQFSPSLLPELSKWERDDESIEHSTSFESKMQSDNEFDAIKSVVTSDVLRKAESALLNNRGMLGRVLLPRKVMLETQKNKELDAFKQKEEIEESLIEQENKDREMKRRVQSIQITISSKSELDIGKKAGSASSLSTESKMPVENRDAKISNISKSPTSQLTPDSTTTSSENKEVENRKNINKSSGKSSCESTDISSAVPKEEALEEGEVIDDDTQNPEISSHTHVKSLLKSSQELLQSTSSVLNDLKIKVNEQVSSKPVNIPNEANLQSTTQYSRISAISSLSSQRYHPYDVNRHNDSSTSVVSSLGVSPAVLDAKILSSSYNEEGLPDACLPMDLVGSSELLGNHGAAVLSGGDPTAKKKKKRKRSVSSCSSSSSDSSSSSESESEDDSEREKKKKRKRKKKKQKKAAHTEAEECNKTNKKKKKKDKKKKKKKKKVKE